MEINIKRKTQVHFNLDAWSIITVCGVSAFIGDLQAVLQRGRGFLGDLFTWKEGAQASRLLYIMLAFFEHFNETKALSVIRAF